MNHLSLFSGIGGFDLAAEWCGWNNVAQVEKDDFCTKVLTKNFPDVPKFRDIKDFNQDSIDGSIDIISGGFPCQPFSVAGKRKGFDDDRYLWPQMFRVISEFKPTWVVGENVANFVEMGIDKTIADLESIAYEVQAFIIPACGVGAVHKRNRVWIIAYLNNDGQASPKIRQGDTKRNDDHQARAKDDVKSKGCGFETTSICPHIDSKRISRKWGKEVQRKPRVQGIKKLRVFQGIGGQQAIPEPLICRVDDGFSSRVDRLKGLGNAIVPQVAYEIFRNIQQVEDVK